MCVAEAVRGRKEGEEEGANKKKNLPQGGRKKQTHAPPPPPQLVEMCGPQHDDEKRDVLLLINSFCDLWLSICIGIMWVILSIAISVS